MTALRTLATAFVLFAALQVLGDNGGGRFVETPLPEDVGAGRDASTMRPQYHLPLDGSAAWSGRDAAAAKPAVVHGAAKWIDGVAGKGLDISRWAYDQATALVADGVPGISTRRGTVAFWFKPHWEQKDGEKHVVLSARSTSRTRRPTFSCSAATGPTASRPMSATASTTTSASTPRRWAVARTRQRRLRGGYSYYDHSHPFKD